MAIVGIYAWERTDPQRVMLNIELEFDGTKAALVDGIEHTIDYYELSQRIIKHVESAQYFLIEKLAQSVLDIVMSDKRVTRAVVELDKPAAIKAADSTSIVVSASK